MNIGNKVRDVEDGDCYREGTIVEINPLRYKLEREVWNGEEYFDCIGEITEPRWWILEVYNENTKQWQNTNT